MKSKFSICLYDILILNLFSYFQKLLPVTDWSQEELKPSFNNLLRRIDRLFTKISKKPATKVFKHIVKLI